MGKERCLQLEPDNNLAAIELAQRETEEACVVLQYIGGNPLSHFDDVRQAIRLAEKGSSLSPRSLLDVAMMLRASRSARDALCTARDNTPLLTARASALTPMRHLEQDITTAIIS